MDIQTFRERGIALYGKHGWITQLAPEIGKSRKTIHRYLNGGSPIPLAVELAMDTLRDRRDREKEQASGAAASDPTSGGGVGGSVSPLAAPPGPA